MEAAEDLQADEDVDAEDLEEAQDDLEDLEDAQDEIDDPKVKAEMEETKDALEEVVQNAEESIDVDAV